MKMENNEVFIVSSDFRLNDMSIRHEINAVYRSEDRANKFAEWLMNNRENEDGEYISCNVDNFLILG